eukprot:13614678-Alexandrium_andersonii.AAC.1
MRGSRSGRRRNILVLESWQRGFTSFVYDMQTRRAYVLEHVQDGYVRDGPSPGSAGNPAPIGRGAPPARSAASS